MIVKIIRAILQTASKKAAKRLRANYSPEYKEKLIIVIFVCSFILDTMEDIDNTR